jgi:diguanylate cyclase (GGDEF)-like protein
LDQALARARRDETHKYALIFIDLDRFKIVNDSLGHAAGDMLLCEVAVRLNREVREADTVCRFGGDEFLILLDGLEAPGNAIAIARRLQEALREPYLLEDRECQLSASLGLFIADGVTESNAEQIIQRGNIAMHWAKESGRDCFKVFTKRLMSRALELMNMENDLRHAIMRDEFFLEYQPIVRTDGSLFGFEALIRWQHPMQGRIAPSRFIPVAEETGVIHALGEWVMAEACRTIAAWNRELGLDLTVSVNMSGRQFGQANATSRIQACLDQIPMPPSWLKVEITESSLMKHLSRPQEILGRLREMGVSLSVDDFGTGYSSLAYLQRLPLDYLKIDRSFVRDLSTNSESEAIVQAIVQLGHTLGMRIIAEGVETQEHLHRLQELGCDLYQGYYFARPLPVDAALEFIHEHARPGWQL